MNNIVMNDIVMNDIVINSPKQSPTLSVLQIPVPSALKLVDITNIKKSKATEYVDQLYNIKKYNDGVVTIEDVDEAENYKFNCHLYQEVPKLTNTLPVIQANALVAALLAPESPLIIFLDNKFNQMDNKFNRLESKLNRLENKFNQMIETQNAMINNQFSELRAKAHNSI